MLAEIANDRDDKMLLMAGAGAESTAETLKITEAMCLADADVLLVVTPSFYKNAMKTSVLVKHFSTIADFSDKPIIIYNVPANTGLGMIPTTESGDITYSRHASRSYRYPQLAII